MSSIVRLSSRCSVRSPRSAQYYGNALQRSLQFTNVALPVEANSIRQFCYLLFPRRTNHGHSIYKPCQIRLMSSMPSHTVVGLPALSPTMEQGTIAKWMVKDGDKFSTGDVLCQVETDKATVDFECQDDGYVGKILVPAGVSDVKVGEPIMIIVEDEASVAAFKNYSDTTAKVEAPSEKAQEQSTSKPEIAKPLAQQKMPTSAPATAGRVFSSPLARSLAKEKGFNLADIRGTGPGGRIIGADVLEFAPQIQTTTPTTAPVKPIETVTGEFTDIELTELAKLAADKMTISKQTVPHYYLTVDLNLEELLAVRKKLNQDISEDGQLSVNDILIKAAALACKAVPDVNSAWMETFVRQFRNVDVNVFINTDNGLVMPLVEKADTAGLKSISDKVKNLVSLAKHSSLTQDQTRCGTFSIVNLGAFGVKSASPIVVPPQACILALGAAAERVLPNDDPTNDQIYKIATCLTATLSCDHRVVDGAVGAQWLAAFKNLVENPLTMLL